VQPDQSLGLGRAQHESIGTEIAQPGLGPSAEEFLDDFMQVLARLYALRNAGADNGEHRGCAPPADVPAREQPILATEHKRSKLALRAIVR